MADTMDALKSILGDNAEEKIKNVMTSLSLPQDDNTYKTESSTNGENGGINQLMRLREMIEQMAQSSDNPRTNLLLSLKPYMRESRRRTIDSAVRLLSLSNITNLLKK